LSNGNTYKLQLDEFTKTRRVIVPNGASISEGFKNRVGLKD
jgi:hypothetical protein